jgi:hypothetical protein
MYINIVPCVHCAVSPSEFLRFIEVEKTVALCNSTRSSDWHMAIVLKLSMCLIKHLAMNAYVEVGSKAPHILELATRCVVSFTHRPLYPW